MREVEVLADCLMGSDAAAEKRAWRQRSRSLLIALLLEAGLTVGMLLWPLATPGVMPHRFFRTPLPPYRGGSGQSARTKPRPRWGRRAFRFGEFPSPILHPPRRFPAHPELWKGNRAGERVEAPEIGGDGMGMPDSGTWLPGGSEEPTWEVQPPKPVHAVPPRIVRQSEGVEQVLLIRKVIPEYPALARQMGVEGTVRLRAIIALDGSVRSVELLSGHPLLARAAIAAVRMWRYRPTILNGKPVEVETSITVIFKLEKSE